MKKKVMLVFMLIFVIALAACKNGKDEWDSAELSKLVPKPAFTISDLREDSTAFAVTFAATNVVDMREYTEKVKSSGFTVNAETSDEHIMGIPMFEYTAYNEDGYKIEIVYTTGFSGFLITRP